jgi:hypothetical protein
MKTSIGAEDYPVLWNHSSREKQTRYSTLGSWAATTSRSFFLALGRQQNFDVAFQYVDEPQSDGHGNRV